MLVIGVAGTELNARERDWLQHDACAGVILFTRNFASRTQVAELAQAIREAAPRPQLVCVDQEGGRVQRFREGYSALPPLEVFGREYARDRGAALAGAREHAWLMASEVRASGVDLSFAPVVDLGRGNLAIGDRAFSEDPHVVAAFTRAYVEGMHDAGMAATLKHFPGHGSVREDTHFDDAVDHRPLEMIQAEDLVPFVAGIEAGADAVMLAHVVYPRVAPEPAGYSPRWIRDILRTDMGFRGVVFSDDIGMAAAHGVGGIKARVDAHLDAGCDVVLVCHPELVEESLAAAEGRSLNTMALAGLMGRGALGWDGLLADARHGAASSAPRPRPRPRPRRRGGGMSAPTLAVVLADAELVHGREVLEAAIQTMADAIAPEYAGDTRPPLFVTIMHGGMPFAAQLAFALGERGLDVEFDYLHATRYRGATSGSRLAWLHRPATPMRGRRVLLVDDILDEGHTLKAVTRWCEDEDAADVRVAVLATKVHDRCVDGVCADWSGVEVPDRYVFGYGMDYNEQGRNLPAIYAMAG